MEVPKIRIRSLKGNSMKLDGGAMFGNAPKAVWAKWMKPDDQNRIDIGSRALCIVTQAYAILFETGAGAYLSPDMKERFQILQDHHVLLDSLCRTGLNPEDITHIVLSHLHFDHAGGLLKAWEYGQESLQLVFPNAQIICGEKNYHRSCHPHLRDRASFIPELCHLLEKSGRLRLVSGTQVLTLGDVSIEFIESNGHTPGMVLSRITIQNTCIYFLGDVAPGHAWVNLPITMGYDRNPEQIIDEKELIFKRILEEDAWLFYTHDNGYAASKIAYDADRKRFVPDMLQEELSLDI